MAITERTYNIPLRKGFSKVSIFKKTNRAVSEVKKFISKHMKSDNVKIGKTLNEELWAKGIKNPPHHVKVTVVKDDSGKVIVDKFGVKIDLGAKKAKKAKAETPMEKLKEAMSEKKAEKVAKPSKTEEKPAVKEEKVKKAEVKETPKKETTTKKKEETKNA